MIITIYFSVAFIQLLAHTIVAIYYVCVCGHLHGLIIILLYMHFMQAYTRDAKPGQAKRQKSRNLQIANTRYVVHILRVPGASNKV